MVSCDPFRFVYTNILTVSAVAVLSHDALRYYYIQHACIVINSLHNIIIYAAKGMHSTQYAFTNKMYTIAANYYCNPQIQFL